MISLIMPTHDGAHVLPITLEAMRRVKLPARGVEILVVNNASRDQSSAIVRSYAAHLPLRLIETATPGRAHALNLAIPHAKGELLVMTDDDVVPDPEWLLRYDEAAGDNPEIDIFAGQIRHHWQAPPPAWLQRLAAEGRSYGGTPVDRPAGPISPEQVKGANLAARRAVFDRLRFDEGLGYKAGGAMVAGEETDLVRRATQEGHRVRYIPDAVVKHIVRPHQVKARAVLTRYFRIGKGVEKSKADCFPEGVPTLFGFPRYLFKTETRKIGRCVSFAARNDTYRAMDQAIDIATVFGRAYQWRQDRKEAPSR